MTARWHHSSIRHDLNIDDSDDANVRCGGPDLDKFNCRHPPRDDLHQADFVLTRAVTAAARDAVENDESRC